MTLPQGQAEYHREAAFRKANCAWPSAMLEGRAFEAVFK